MILQASTALLCPSAITSSIRHRDLTRPILDYIDRLFDEHPGTVVTVVIPEVVVRDWWQQVLHNHSAFALLGGPVELISGPGVVRCGGR